MTMHHGFEVKCVRFEGTVEQDQLDNLVHRLYVSGAYQSISGEQFVLETVGHVLIEGNPFETIWDPIQLLVSHQEEILLVQAVDVRKGDGIVVFAAITKSQLVSGANWSPRPNAVIVSVGDKNSDDFLTYAGTMSWKLRLLDLIFGDA